MKRKSLLIILLMSLSVFLAACSTDKPVEQPKLDSPATSDKDDDNDDDVKEEEINEIMAFDMFVDKYPNVKVTEVELDTDYGDYYYKIEGYLDGQEYKMKFMQSNGEVILDEVEKDDDDNDIEITKSHVEKVKDLVDKTMAEADASGMLDEWSLETDNNRLVLEVEVDQKNGSDIEITYDLDSGDIIKRDN